MSERQIGLRKRVKPYTPVPNDTVEDFTIGYRELGLLTRILRMPEGFVIRSEQLANEGQGKTLRGRKPDREGRGAVRTTLRNLALAGYYRLVRIRMQDGTFCMATDISEDPLPTWAAQAAVFGGKPVPLFQQRDGSHKVKYPNGVLLPEDSMPPEGLEPAVSCEDGGEDGAGETGQIPKTGFRSPGNRAPQNRATEKAATGEPSSLTEMVSEDGQQDSVPASQVRLGDAERETDSSSVDGQITITGEVEPTQVAPSAEADENRLVMGIARAWLAEWKKNGGLVTTKGDPLMALRGVIEKARAAGATENEIKFALMWSDRDVPEFPRLGDGILQVRRGWRPAQDWKPGDGRGRPAGRQRNGTGAMAGTNLHVDDLTPEERQERNPFTGAARQSDYVEQRGAVA